jgi:hypothetical protein
MSDNRTIAFLAAGCFLVLVLTCSRCQMASDQCRAESDQAAIKAGLVQKRTSGGTLVWTKPTEPADTRVVEQ